MLRSACVIFICLLFAGSGWGLTERRVLGPLQITYYAPSWTWQGRDINALITIVNAGATRETVEITMRFPGRALEAFGSAGVDLMGGALRMEPFELAPGESVRKAFTGVTAGVHAPVGIYGLAFETCVDGVTDTIPYEVEVIRGEAFSGSRWAALVVPAGFALLWCAVFIAVLARFVDWRVWLRPGDPIAVPETVEAWIEKAPS